MESGEIKSRSPFSTETDIFYCLEAPGNPYQFLHWQTSYLNTTGDGVYTEKPHSTGGQNVLARENIGLLGGYGEKRLL